MFGRKKTPSEQIIASEERKTKLRKKRNNLNSDSPSYEQKKWKINNEIHKENVKIDVANKELKQPITNKTTVNKKTTVNNSFSYNNNSTENGVHIHGHYHSSGKKKK